MTDRSTPPPVCVAIPVYNGQAHLEAAIQSVLSQSFKDLELLICDNASTDATPDIARRYAQADPRVRYVRWGVNRGAAWNFNQAFAMSRSPYFKWLAADDLMTHDCLLHCAAALDADPHAILAYPRCTVIDAGGQVQSAGGTFPYDRVQLGDHRPERRFADILQAHPSIYPLFGLIRRDVLQRSSMIRSHIGADGCLLARLALMGRFVHVPMELLQVRWHEGSFTCRINMFRAGREGLEDLRWYDTRTRAMLVLPHWRRLWEHAAAAVQFGSGLLPRMRMLTEVARLACWWRRQLTQELLSVPAAAATLASL